MEGDTVIRPMYVSVLIDTKHADNNIDGTFNIIIDGETKCIDNINFEYAVLKSWEEEPLLEQVNRALARMRGTMGIKEIRIR